MANPTLEALFGYSSAQMCQHHFRYWTHADDVAASEALVRRMLDGESDLETIEKRYMHMDGHLIWARTLVAAVRDEAGKVLYFITMVVDITERKLNELQLRKLSLAVEQSPESVVITNLDAEIEYVNAAFLRATGYTREEVMGQNPRILHSGKTPSETYVAMWDALNAGRVWKGEFFNRRKDGTEYLESAIVTPIRQPDGTISHYVAVKEDITERKQVAQELEQHRHHLEELVAAKTAEARHQAQSLRALIDTIPHMAWLKDREGRFLAANRAIAEVNGRTVEELLGKTDLEVWPRAMAERYRADDAEVMASRRQKISEEPTATDPDSLYETFKAPILDADGSVLGTVGFSRDIKRQRQLEAELARRAEEAQAANRAKSVFLANMSHEIRTPMNAIIGLTHLLRQRLATPKDIEDLRKIDGAARHLLGIINDILDISKIEAAKLTLEETDFALEALLDHVASLIGEPARAKGLRIVVDADDVPHWLKGDQIGRASCRERV